jgi:hypothetical protein
MMMTIHLRSQYETGDLAITAAACGYALRARDIMTWDVTAVTCRRCLGLIAQIGASLSVHLVPARAQDR